MTDQNEPLVSICCITYNHEKFIADAISGFLMQKTTFPFEIIIHDDASTDSTRDVIMQYQSEHPDLIRTIFQTENQYSQGNHAFPFTFQAAKGKYLALCEGDDYWIDPYKLQKQVDFLENNPEYVICYHNNVYYYQDTNKPLVLREDNPWDTYTLSDVIKYNVYTAQTKTTIPGHTATAVFRSDCVTQLPNWCLSAYNIDIPLFIHISRFGLSKFFPETMSVYRVHNKGLSRGQKGLPFFINRANMYKAINKEFHHKYSKTINPIVSKIYLRALIRAIKDKDSKQAFRFLIKAIILNPKDITHLIEKYFFEINQRPIDSKDNFVD